VIGCGRGHDARYLARRGYDVVGFDFSPAALRDARALARRDDVKVDFEQRDIFSLPREYGRTFDGVGNTPASAPSILDAAASTPRR